VKPGISQLALSHTIRELERVWESAPDPQHVQCLANRERANVCFTPWAQLTRPTIWRQRSTGSSMRRRCNGLAGLIAAEIWLNRCERNRSMTRCRSFRADPAPRRPFSFVRENTYVDAGHLQRPK
jgi:hypothetical protein